MAEPVADPEPVEEPPVAQEEPERPVVAEPALSAPQIPVREPAREPEPAIGDTPLSAIERLAGPVDFSPPIRNRHRGHVLTAAWAASFAILTALGVAGYTQRNVLMREWPASKRVYATLGLAPMEGNASVPGVTEGPGAAGTPTR